MRPRSHAYLFREAATEVRLAEELGFDGFWIGEHHFSYDGYNPSAVPVLAYLASATETISMGSGIMLFALHTAGEVARQCAAFHDALPGRRLRLGIGAGYVAKEFLAHRISFDERGRVLEEQLDALLGEHAEYFGDTELWMGGNIDRAFRRAARYGASLLLTQSVGPRRLRQIRELWESELTLRNQEPRVAIQCYVWPTDDRASQEWFRRRFYESWKGYQFFAQSAEPPWSRRDGSSSSGDTFLQTMTNLSVIASPGEVVEKLGELIEAGADELAFQVRFGSPSHGQVVESLERLASDVIPQLRTIR